MTPRILIVAGSDSGGGAGIQADIKTVTMLGGHAMTAVTAITAQNTLGVQAAMPVPTDMVLAQIDSCLSDIGADAVKIGMIGSADTAHAVAERLERLDVPIVFDPVMVATSGAVLADADTIEAFERLMAIATITTPNLPELAVLEQHSLSRWEREGAAQRRKGEGEGDDSDVRACRPHPSHASGAGSFPLTTGEGLAARHLLVKGGHADGSEITDRLLRGGQEIARWNNPRITTRHSHGTGCTLASAVAAGLGAGLSLTTAIDRAIGYVRAALAHAPGLGEGHGPMGHALGVSPYDMLYNAQP